MTEIVLGIVYVKKTFYMNLVLTVLNYSIYECTDGEYITKNDYNDTYIFMTKDIEITSDKKYKNIGSRIIWLKM